VSFMPDIGTVVRMVDGRIAIVADFNGDGSEDKVMFADGHEEPTDAWQIAERLTDKEYSETQAMTEPADLLGMLQRYLDGTVLL